MTLKKRIEKIEERLRMKKEGGKPKPLIVSLPDEDGNYCPLENNDLEKCPVYQAKKKENEKGPGVVPLLLVIDCYDKKCPYYQDKSPTPYKQSKISKREKQGGSG